MVEKVTTTAAAATTTTTTTTRPTTTAVTVCWWLCAEAERQRRIRKPQDCYDQYFLIGQTRNDQYRVFFSDEEFPVMAYCDMSDGGGWTVVWFTYLLTYLLAYLPTYLLLRSFACLFII